MYQLVSFPLPCLWFFFPFVFFYIQDMCEFLDIKELTATAEFPRALEQLTGLLDKVNSYNEIRMRLTVEMAESSAAVKV